MSKREIGPFVVVIGVTSEGDAVVMAVPDDEDIERWTGDNGIWAEDNGFTGLPEEPGLYNCLVAPHWSDEMELEVVSAEKIAAIVNGVGVASE